MKTKTIILIFLAFTLSNECNAENLVLVCKSAQHTQETHYTEKLDANYAAFVDVDDFYTRKITKCKEGKCVSYHNRTLCRENKDSFKIRFLDGSGEKIVVFNRCDGGLKKFVKANESNDFPYTYVEDKMLYQILHLHQYRSGFSTQYVRHPALILDKNDSNNVYTLKVAGFKRDMIIEKLVGSAGELSNNDYIYMWEDPIADSFYTNCVQKN